MKIINLKIDKFRKLENVDFKIDGGIVIEKYPNWKINRNENYSYENDKDWDILDLK